MQWKRPSWMTDEKIELLLNSKKDFNKAADRDIADSLMYALSRYGKVTDFIVTKSVSEPTRIDLSIEPYSAYIDADGKVRSNYEKLNTACEELNKNLTKSILDKYDLSYIDTDTDIAATNEAFEKYILEGTKMPIKTHANDSAFGWLDQLYKYPQLMQVPEVKKIIHSGLWTIVTWEDGTLTKIKMEDDGHYDEYAAFTAALAKKVYGNNSKVHKILETKTVEQKQKSKKKEDSKC